MRLTLKQDLATESLFLFDCRIEFRKPIDEREKNGKEKVEKAVEIRTRSVDPPGRPVRTTGSGNQ